MSSEVVDEDGMLRHVNGKWHLGEYGKIYGISTFRISPDIDLVHIDESSGTVTGYEFKLLTYHKGWRRPNFLPLYSGIGQAMSYFQFGVDRSYLVLGISKKIPKSSVHPTMDMIDGVLSVFVNLKTFVEGTLEKRKSPNMKFLSLHLSTIPLGIDCLGLKIWNEHDDTLVTRLEATRNFPVAMEKDLQHQKDCLLRKEFKCKYEK